MDILSRIERWHRYAKARGITLTRIAIHPSDVDAAPTEYHGLPVVALNNIE